MSMSNIEDADFVEATPVPPEEPKTMIEQARELVPVTPMGIVPANLSQLVDFAKDMAKARFSLPEHMHQNVGDCLAIIDIATRAGLSPFMLALQTYIDPKTKRMAFMSQAYHALASPWLKGDFEVEYEGDGEDLICTIVGVLKTDPENPRRHTSEKLSKARPARNDQGIVKGSPLWDRKPKVQLFYDTSRDWVRLFCPRATLGIYTPDELAEYRGEFARDVTPGLSKRLRAKSVSRKEGAGSRDAAADVKEAQNGARSKKKIKTPTNPAEWETFARAWITEGTDAAAMRRRWKEEQKLRNTCGVVSEQKKPVEALLEQRCGELQS